MADQTIGRVDTAPHPSFLERLGGAYETNPAYTQWANGHNAANAADRAEFAKSQAESLATAHREAGGSVRAERTQLANETTINNHLPAGALAMGTGIDDGKPGGSVIRDINVVSVDGKSWGFVYRTADGTLMLQRDPASVPGQSETTTVGGQVGSSVNVGPKDGLNGSFSANVSTSHGTTTTNTQQQAVVALTDPDKQLPASAYVTPLRNARGDVLPGSSQLIPPNPHGNETTYDQKNPAPDKFDVVTPMIVGQNQSDKPYAVVAMNREGQTSLTVTPPNQERGRSAAMELG